MENIQKKIREIDLFDFLDWIFSNFLAQCVMSDGSGTRNLSFGSAVEKWV